MVKRILAGTATLVLLALAVIVISVVQFDLPREKLVGKYAGGASQFVTLPSGASAHVRDEGNPGGPVLVLVHGSNASLHTWEPWVAELGDTYRIISMDLPGHGLTGRVPGDDYTRNGMASFVHEVMGTLHVERFAIARPRIRTWTSKPFSPQPIPASPPTSSRSAAPCRRSSASPWRASSGSRASWG